MASRLILALVLRFILQAIGDFPELRDLHGVELVVCVGHIVLLVRVVSGR